MRFPGGARPALLRRGARALPAEDRHAQRPGLMMAAIYRALLDEIAGDDYGCSTSARPDPDPQALDRVADLGHGLSGRRGRRRRAGPDSLLRSPSQSAASA